MATYNISVEWVMFVIIIIIVNPTIGHHMEGVQRKPKSKLLLMALITGVRRTNSGCGSEITFILDSGFTSHPLNDETMLTSRAEIDESVCREKRYLNLDIKSLGTLLLKYEHGRQHILYDVKYSPNFVANLLNGRKFRSNGCNV